MEAAMRLRSPSHIIFVVVLFVAESHSSRAVAQIEFAKSTIRIVPTTEAAPTPQPVAKPAVRPRTVPQPIQQPSSFKPVVQASAAADVKAEPAKRYPVRQADFVAPIAARPVVQAPPSAPVRAPSIVNVYSSSNAQSTLGKMPRPAPVHRSATTTAPPKPLRGKPFQDVQSEPVISPYMNLYRNDVNAPTLSNYLTMVRPQIEQQQVSRQQTAEIQKLRGQLQNLSGGSAPNSGSMSAHAHYMDTAQFYRGVRR
jgi:hypothetical protein